MQQTESAPRAAGKRDIAQRNQARRDALRWAPAPGPSGATDGPMSYGPRGPADPSDPEAHIFRGED